MGHLPPLVLQVRKTGSGGGDGAENTDSSSLWAEGGGEWECKASGPRLLVS